MAVRDIVQTVEIDAQQCTRTFGVAPCLATLSAVSPRKCFNTFQTCTYKQGFNNGINTLKFIEASYPVSGDNYFPCVKSISGYDQEVNIAGFNPNLGGLGKRAQITIKMADFPYGDVLTDKYWRERITGAAQVDEPGYDPIDRGSFWSKFKARTPNFSGRGLRVRNAYYNADGTLSFTKTRSYVISELNGPDTNGDYTIVAKDILSLADNDKAQAPRVSRGRLLADIGIADTTATLSPTGIGNSEYPESGWATIGSEIVRFTRVSNVLTLARGVLGTQPATHSVNDTVQVGYRANNLRVDVVIRDLLVNYAGIDPAWIPAGQWADEVDRWGGTLILNSMICQPTGVTNLLGEICELGLTLWWDEVAQLIRLRMNRPNEVPTGELSDRDSFITIARKDEDNQRATRVAFWSVQIDPTKGLSKENFLRNYISVFVDAESPNFYGQSITKTIYNRWLNQGNDAATKIITGRLLNRYKRAPVNYEVTVDVKDELELLDVININSYAATDDTGRPVPALCQVFYRADDKAGSTVKLKLQAFQYDENYAYIAPNPTPVYSLASGAQKERYGFIVGPSLSFSDARPAYQIV